MRARKEILRGVMRQLEKDNRELKMLRLVPGVLGILDIVNHEIATYEGLYQSYHREDLTTDLLSLGYQIEPGP